MVAKKSEYLGGFIAFEGPEGAGKSTQLKILHQHLEQLDVPHVVTRDPGGTALGRQIRRILLNTHTCIDHTAELLLYEADRAQHVHEVIRPALNKGKLVLCDRYVGSTYAYQGWGRGMSLDLIKQLNNVATQGIMPDLTILFDLPSESGLDRLHPSGHDRLESEAIEFHHKVRAGYLQLAQANPLRWKIINAALPLSQVQDELRAILAQHLDIRAIASKRP